MNAEEIFHAALGRAGIERAEFLATACSADESLRRRVEALLAAHENPGSFLAHRPSMLGETIDAPATDGPGTVIGPYKLLEQIGEGGFGVVFMAEQTEPVRRKVALKILKAGMDTRQVVARFEAERQALAIMDHPNIARVFDGGSTEPDAQARAGAHSLARASGSSRPYFVMELVKGTPITEFCDAHHLTPRERLELFIPVCQAIQHAHQKGIIHRDLKPSNVLVSRHDTTPVPKVIDFGVAKALGQELTDKTLFTALAQMIGTPLYMSPEQAGMSDLDVDTRSDIYSLGVLLYELLTGTTPFDKERFKRAPHDEIRRIIREEDPPKPSTRLSHLGTPHASRAEGGTRSVSTTLASVSASRQTEPGKLTRLMRGELDWIVMKCLEKDRNRRYETASAFAADVRRYLNDEPVLACPPSLGYRVRKFARRNKGPVAAGVALSALLVLGTVGTSAGMAWALRAEKMATAAAAQEALQRQEVETQRDKALGAEERAVTEKQRADEEAAIAKAVNDFLKDDLLAEAAPDKNARNKKVTVEEVLGRAATRIAGKFDQQPRIEAAIRLTIGNTYHRLGDFQAARPHLERARELYRSALGEEHPDTLSSMSELAGLYTAQADYPKAEPLYVTTLEVRRRVLGEEHHETLGSMNNLGTLYEAKGQYVQAEALYAKALEIGQRVLGEEHADTIIFLSNLARLYQAQGQFTKAEPLFVRSLELRSRVLGEEHPETIDSLNNLASLHQNQGEFAKAEPLFVQALELSRRVSGEDHPNTFTAKNNLAELYQLQSQFAKAEPLFVQALADRRRVLGEEHPVTLATLNNLAMMYRTQGLLTKAEPLLIEVLEVCRRVLGPDHPDTLRSTNNLAAMYWSAKKLDRSVPLFEEALRRYRATLGPDHPGTLLAMANLGVNYRDAGRREEGIALLEQAWESARNRPGPLAATLAWVPTTLAVFYEQAGEYAKAEPLYFQELEVRRRDLGEEHPETLSIMSVLASLYRHQGKLALAEPLYAKTLEIRRRVLGEEHPHTLAAMHNLALLYQSRNQLAKAEPLFVQTLAGQRRVLGDEHSETLTTMNSLAALYRRQHQYAKAEPLFVKTLEVRRRVLGEEHSETLNTMNSLAVLYHVQGQYAKAEPLFVQAAEVRRRVLGEEHYDTFVSIGNLAGVYRAQGQISKADLVYREAVARIHKRHGETSPAAAGALASFGLNLLQQKKYADAEPLLRESLRIREQMLPEEWTTFHAKVLLGRSLLGQEKHAAAEPLLVTGYEGMKRHEASIPREGKPYLTEALDRLVQLYDTWGKKDQADQWRKQLEAKKEADKKAENPNQN